jgi:hypothetical protein
MYLANSASLGIAIVFSEIKSILLEQPQQITNCVTNCTEMTLNRIVNSFEDSPTAIER